MFLDILGFVAALLTTAGFVPQFMKVYKTKSTHDISLIMFIALSIGIILWLIYGILLNAVPVIVANAAGLIFVSGILIAKLKYK